MNYNIIATGSKGNALLLDNKVLIDCGIPFKKINEYVKGLKLVLLTHIHTDHFNKTTISKLAILRPTLRFGCCEWLVQSLIDCGVKKKNIDVYEIGKRYRYNQDLAIQPLLLYHNVEQCGYRVFINDKKCIYCTDTVSVDGISAKNYDYYFIEANHTEQGIRDRIEEKRQQGIYPYELEAMYNHLSKEKCDKFLMENMGESSIYEYMHQHKD